MSAALDKLTPDEAAALARDVLDLYYEYLDMHNFSESGAVEAAIQETREAATYRSDGGLKVERP